MVYGTLRPVRIILVTNGLAERYVREFKNLLRKNNGKDDLETNLQSFLFAHRAFPQTVIKEFPGGTANVEKFKIKILEFNTNMRNPREVFYEAVRRQEQFTTGCEVYFRNYATGPKREEEVPEVTSGNKEESASVHVPSCTPKPEAAAVQVPIRSPRPQRARKPLDRLDTSMETEDIVPSTSAVHFVVPHTTSTARTNAQRQREYRLRKALTRTPEQRTSVPVVAERTSVPLTNAQRQRAFRQRRAASSRTDVQPTTSSSQTALQLEQSTWYTKWSSSIRRFQSTFLDNDFGHACSVCDRLWFKNDLKTITALQLKVISDWIQGCHSMIRFISKTIKGLIALTSAHIPPAEFVNLITQITKEVKLQNAVIGKRHEQKLRHWSCKYGFPRLNQETKKSNIINISNTALSQSEAIILYKGLKYRIPEKPDPFITISGIESAINKFSYQNENQIRNYVSYILQKSTTQQYNYNESAVIKRLKRREDLVITRSDKGSHIVIMNRSEYQSKIKDILDDVETFSSITEISKNQIYSKFKKSLNTFKRNRLISEDEHKKFSTNLSSSPYIYGLPKTHKPSIPLRPIIAYHLSPASALSRFLTSFFTPLIKRKENSYSITGIPSFLEELSQLNPAQELIMCSFDVVSLYLSLPHQFIIESVTEFLIDLNTDITIINKIEKLCRLCLDLNVFLFDGQWFQQIRGSPMGSPLSTVVAELVMSRLDRWNNSQHALDLIFWRSHKITVVKTLTKRIFTHCSLPCFKTIEQSNITNHLTALGYPISFIHRHSFNPNFSRQPRTNRTHCTIPYSKVNATIAHKLNKYGIATYFSIHANLGSLLRNPITKNISSDPLSKSNAIYSVK
ncbi:hypothetical protein LAZ67_10001920 [Cordylochernes scorpioides]|uniref:Reverse transcriptase domain-containing protein n=1 Tax=Cordylochernes scorpioides TaxID=51811 RepID=A0ABY6KW89_9ARAC|nr:hypothetical protein LAZ67_10001920 [Cordylochernes scorpioides]